MLFRTKHIVILLLNSLLSCAVFGQIGGISASKLSSYTTIGINKHDVEFEPTFGTSLSSSYWDNNGNLINSNAITQSSNIMWRVSYGLSHKTEVGFSIDSDASSVSIGMKTILSGGNKIQFSGMTGINLALGNRTFDPDKPGIDDVSSYAVGIIGSWFLNERNSVDANLTFQDYFKDVTNQTGSAVFVSADYGHYIENKSFQYLLSISYESSNIGTLNRSGLTITPGVSIETGDNFLFVINTSHTLTGTNMDKSLGISIALTTTIH